MQMQPDIHNPELLPVVAPQQSVTMRPVADSDLVPRMITDIKTAKAAIAELKEFIKEVMVLDQDYGRIPGTPKNTLYKPGAEKLLEVYGYTALIRTVSCVERWDKSDPFFHYQMACDVYSKRTGNLISSHMGSCNSLEARYRWRDKQRDCPACHAEAIIKGKPEFGGGWLCYAKKGGCGAKFKIDDPQIADQDVGKVENDDPYTLVNTILKMAAKRAMVAAALAVTRSSDLFVPEDDTEDDEGGNQRGGQRQGRGQQTKGNQTRGKDDPAPDGRTAVQTFGRTYRTKGITGVTLQKVWEACKSYDAAKGKDAHKGFMKQKTGTEIPIDLTEEQGTAFLPQIEAAAKAPASPQREPGDETGQGGLYDNV